MVYERDDIEGLDSSIILNRLVWKYSGHEDTFSDPLVDCRECNSRLRADKLDNGKCPNCGSKDLTEPRPFNLMFQYARGRYCGRRSLVTGLSKTGDCAKNLYQLRQRAHDQ